MSESPGKMYAFAAVFCALPTLTLALRFYARHKASQRVLWDDWTIVIAWMSTIATGILLVVAASAGELAQHIQKGPDGKRIYTEKSWMFARMMYGNDLSQLPAIGLTKVSVLLFYRRIFAERRRFNIISMVLIYIVFAWIIAFFFGNMFQNDPINASWTKTALQRKKSIDQTTMYLAQSYADVALDVIIISLPIPIIWSMQMGLSRKLGISCIFLLGALTTAASITRTVIQYKVAQEFDKHNPDSTYYLAPINYWPFIEASLGIVGACLPMLGPAGRGRTIKSIMGSIKSTFSRSRLVRGSGESDQSGPPLSKQPSHSSVSEKQSATAIPADDSWLKAYHTSALDKTIDNETHIESVSEEDRAQDSDLENGITVARTAKVHQ